MSSFKSGELVLEAGSTIFSEGTNSPHLYTVLSGWAFKYKTLEDGRRQVLNYMLPGDFIGLQASIFRDHRPLARSIDRCRTVRVPAREAVAAL